MIKNRRERIDNGERKIENRIQIILDDNDKENKLRIENKKERERP